MKFEYLKVRIISESFKDDAKRIGLDEGQINFIKLLYTPNNNFPIERFLNKYGGWLGLLIKNNSPLENNYGLPDGSKEALDKFERFHIGDIMQMSSMGEVIEAVNSYEEERRQASMRTHTGHHGTTEYSAYDRKKQKQAMKKALPTDADSKTLAENEYYTLRYIKTYKGSVKYGCDQAKGPGWCVSRSDTRNHWDSMTGPGFFVFADFGDAGKVQDFLNKITDQKPLPKDKISRMIVMLRAVSPEVYKKRSDEEIRKKLTELSSHPQAEYKEYFEKQYNKTLREYNEKFGMEGDPAEHVKLALLFNRVDNTGGMFASVWNMKDKSNTKMGQKLVQGIFADPETASELKANGMNWKNSDLT